MDFLLIGLSRFARRRVLPAADALPGITRIDVASAHADARDLADVAKLGRLHRDWRDAVTAARPGLVYVSSANGDHAEAVRLALRAGHHVVVDKPALPDLATAVELVELARSSSLVLAEATCYPWHPAFAVVESTLADFGAEITKAVAVFTPPVPPDDWRHDRLRGGGALADNGPYAVSLGRVLWGVEPESVNAVVGDRAADGLPTSFSLLAGYPGGRTVVGQFGFTTAYQNTVRLLGRGFAIEVQRPFSAPPGMTVEVVVQVGGDRRVHTVEPADSMAAFLSDVLAAIAAGSGDLMEPLLSDARVLARLTRAASGAGST
ncbi:putative oxidoreductase [Actinokineospora spheciospongiae]|uniref:Putative oxidoreductase n=2 Tax=Actinokineospora spheciospongiae TaxID=909613 RepID=W7J633_9PSEU|nr:putative oxidoreductase [Actinokineospora spheciospongiae]